ncbi:MAG TPA: ABC transporter substrate binding protein [Vicinamibacterales bacterium]
MQAPSWRFPAVSLAVLSGVWVCSISAQPGPPRTVLALHWSSEDFPGIPDVDGAIREVLLSRPDMPVDYFAEYLESDRFPPEEAALALRDYIHRKFLGKRIAVVLAISDPALQFALQNRPELFPDAPIVASVGTVPDADTRHTGGGLTGVVGRVADEETLELALRLHPTTERVFVVAQSSSGGLRDTVEAELAAFAPRVQLTYIDDRSVSGLVAAVKAVPPRSLIFFVRHSQEEPGNVMFPPEIARLVAQASPVPVYGISDGYLGTGVVGGVVSLRRALGTRIGEMTHQILDGARAQDIPFEQVPVIPAFDWRQVRRWGINPSLLPQGSDIRFRVPTPWELYRWYIVGAIALVAVQGVLIASLVIQRSRRRDTEARNTAILRAVPDMMFLLSSDGICLDCHAPGDSRPMRKPEEFVGRRLREVLPPQVAAACEDHFARPTPRHEPAMVEYQVEMPGGDRHYEARVVPCGDDQALAVVRDLTERRRVEAALRDSRERYALATAAGNVGVWDWNLETNEIYVDPALKALLGYQDHEIRNHLDDWGRRVHPDDVPAVMERVEAHIQGKSPFYEVEHRMVHRDGSLRWFLARGSAVRKDGRPVRVVGTDTDITARKKSEQDLHEAQADLSRVSRLTALGEFAASIAHEVRQPLTAILMNAKTCLRWIGDATPDLNEIRAALLDVVDAGRRADEVIRRNRELFKHQTVQKAPLDINEVISDVTVLARTRLHGSDVILSTSLAGNLPPVNGDRVELQQVLLNLVANSIDALEMVDPGSRSIEVSSSLTDGVVKVSVRDTGVGLDGVDVQRMFTLSYTTKPSGTGVGLAVSRSIVEAHGGQLWAEQNASGGATFSFTVSTHPTDPV